METDIREGFLPALFRVEEIDDDLRALLSNGVKTGGISVRNPVTTAAQLLENSVNATEVLVEVMLSNGVLNSTVHKATV